MSQEDIKKLTPKELGAKAVEGLSLEEINKREETIFGAQWDLVKYGVQKHSGCLNDKSEEIPLVKDDGGCLADSTIELYELNGILAGLANEIFVFNRPTEEQRKNLS